MSAIAARRSDVSSHADNLNVELDHVVAQIQSVNRLAEGSHELDELRKAGKTLRQAFASATPSESIVMFKNIASIAGISGALSRQYHHESLEHLVRALTPAAPVASSELKKRMMLMQARSELLGSGDWVNAQDIAELANFSKTNASAQPNKWKRAGRIFAIALQSQDYFPLFALDPQTHRPRKVIAAIIEKFGAAKDAWGLAYWFASVNGYLGGKRPQDMLDDAPEQVLAAVDKELAVVAHG